MLPSTQVCLLRAPAVSMASPSDPHICATILFVVAVAEIALENATVVEEAGIEEAGIEEAGIEEAVLEEIVLEAVEDKAI